jgi:hypothetical protein
MHSLKTTPALSFVAKSPGKADLETDFALFWQDSIWGEQTDGIAFGECKSYGTFETRDFERMRYIAATFPGAVLVFATLRKTLTAKEVRAITRLARAGRKRWKSERPVNPVLILTGNELLSFEGPPYCWKNLGFDKKFDRVRGLLSVCDATQQIYLKLPSWETEWHDRRLRRSRGTKVPFQAIQP